MILATSPSLRQEVSECNPWPRTVGVNIPNRSSQQLLRKREQHIRPHDTRDGSCTVQLRVSFLSEPNLGSIINLNGYTTALKSFSHVPKSKVHDSQDGLTRKFVEDEHGIQPIEKFGWEVCRGSLENFVFGFVRDFAVPVCGGLVGKNVATDVACEAYDGVLGVRDKNGLDTVLS